MNDIIKLKNVNSVLSSNEGPVYVLNDVSFAIEEGKIIGLVGESGSGKTQLSMAFSGMQDLTPGVVDGSVEINVSKQKFDIYPSSDNYLNKMKRTSNNNFKRVREYKYNKIIMSNTDYLKRYVFGWIPQDPRNFLNPYWTLERLFHESYKLRKSIEKNFSTEFYCEKNFAEHYLSEVDLDPEDSLSKYPHELSGGQCQRAMIAFVLSKNPKFIIADETTTGLDVSRQKVIIDLFKKIKDNNPKLTVILISHDFGFLHHLVDHYMVMYGGLLVENIVDKDQIRNPDALHPYTNELLSRLWGDSVKTKSSDELTLAIDPLQKLNNCPYFEACPVTNDDDFKNIEKCKSELPPIVDSRNNSHTDIDIKRSWRRCWRDFNGE